MIEMTPLNGDRDDDRNTRLLPTFKKISTKQSPAQKPLRSSLWLDSWLFEWMTLTFSVACFIAISIVLWIYDKKVRPEMAYGLSLNTIVSVLATGCKSALVLVIGEAISQLKWQWFQDPKQRQGQLIGMQRFDAASRGPLGSLMIVIHHRAQSLVSLGAAIIILLLAFDPFMQQILSYPVHPTMDTSTTASAFAPQLRGFILQDNPGTPIIELDGNTLGDELDDSFTQGFFSRQDFSVPPHCSSGNCTWNEFSSVGICSSCSDMTSTVLLDCKLPPRTEAFNRTCKLSFPGSVVQEFRFTNTFLEDTPVLEHLSEIIWKPMDMRVQLRSLLSEDSDGYVFNLPNYTLAGVTNPLTTVAYVKLGLYHTPLSPNASVSDGLYIKNATGCSLSTCLRNYNILVKNGEPSVQIGDIDFGTIYLKHPGATLYRAEIGDDGGYANPLCWMPGPPDAAGYEETRDFAFCHGRMYLLGEVRNYLPPTRGVSWAFSDTYGMWYRFSEGSGEDYGGGELIMKQLERVGLEKAIANIAASLTKHGLEITNHSVNGTVHVTNVFVNVRWPWMILPGLLVLLGVIFLVVTITVSKKSHIPLWKSSALAAYYHGLEKLEDGDNDHDELKTASTMEKKAEEENVRLQRSEKNGKLVLRQQGASEVDPAPSTRMSSSLSSLEQHPQRERDVNRS